MTSCQLGKLDISCPSCMSHTVILSAKVAKAFDRFSNSRMTLFNKSSEIIRSPWSVMVFVSMNCCRLWDHAEANDTIEMMLRKVLRAHENPYICPRESYSSGGVSNTYVLVVCCACSESSVAATIALQPLTASTVPSDTLETVCDTSSFFAFWRLPPPFPCPCWLSAKEMQDRL